MGPLTLAKSIADNPSVHSIDQLRDAHAYLSKLRTNGGVRNSERASQRLERRLLAISDELMRRTGESSSADGNDDNDFGTLVRTLADTPMSCETPGVARDDLGDQIIGLSRQWLARESKAKAA